MSLRNFKTLTSTNYQKVVHLLETLSDGSKGHTISIRFNDDSNEILIDCINKKAAEQLFDLLADKDKYFID